MKLTTQNSNPEKRLQVVDLVRAVAILVVLAVHFGSLYISKPSHPYILAYLWYRIWITGGYGVTIFFVISGFVITRLIASQTNGLYNPNYGEFYTRRVGRILPLLIFICLLGIIMISLFQTPYRDFQCTLHDVHMPMGFSFWASIATFTFNWHIIFSEPLHFKHFYALHWHVLWTLAIEEQFYFFYPLLLKRLGNERNLIVFLSFIIIFGPISTILLGHIFSNYPSISENSFCGFASIAIGCLLYVVSTKYEKYFQKNKTQSIQSCLLGLFLIFVFYDHHYVTIDYWWFFWANTGMSFGVFFFLLGGLHLNFFKSSYWSIPAFIGKLSYGGYLYHAVTLFLLWPFLVGKNEYFDFMTYVFITFSIAHLSYKYFELPANLFIRKTLLGQK